MTSLLTRVLYQVEASVILAWYGVLATILLFLGGCIEAMVLGQTFYFVDYSAMQWGLILVIGILLTVTLTLYTIAMQNENPAFLSLIGYVGVVYAFIGDIFLFHVEFTTLELITAFLLVALTALVICDKLRVARY